MPCIKLADRQEISGAYWAQRMCKVASLGEGIGMFLVEFSEGVPHKLHRHPRHAEIVYVAAGSIEQTIEGEETQTLVAGEAAVIPRDVRHAARPLEPHTTVIVVLSGEGRDYESIEDQPAPIPESH
jgi:quercetin dioxygenase-like cupin family protein